MRHDSFVCVTCFALHVTYFIRVCEIIYLYAWHDASLHVKMLMKIGGGLIKTHRFAVCECFSGTNQAVGGLFDGRGLYGGRGHRQMKWFNGGPMAIWAMMYIFILFRRWYIYLHIYISMYISIYVYVYTEVWDMMHKDLRSEEPRVDPQQDKRGGVGRNGELQKKWCLSTVNFQFYSKKLHISCSRISIQQDKRGRRVRRGMRLRLFQPPSQNLVWRFWFEFFEETRDWPHWFRETIFPRDGRLWNVGGTHNIHKRFLSLRHWPVPNQHPRRRAQREWLAIKLSVKHELERRVLD